MKSLKTGALISTAVALISSGMAAKAATTEAVTQLVSEGTVNLSFRYRFEAVDQDNPLEKARASTLKSRLTLKTGTVNGFTALVEADDVATIGADDYNSTVIDDEHFGSHSVVADPVGTEINQGWISYAFTEHAGATLGRQRILHAGQRFVGGVGWRQNEQTYDAGTLRYERDGYTVDYGYIWRVNRIFGGSGTSIQPADFRSDSHILLASMPAMGGKLSGYIYALDFEEAPALSSITYGVGYDGGLGPLTVSASIATQSDYSDNPVSYDAMYLALEASVDVKPATLIAGYELLGSDDGTRGFATPLATLHKFQGWTDQFLTTPANGVEDLYFGVNGRAGPVILGVFHHEFSADEGGDDYGSEVDLVATWPVNEQITLALKYGDYRSDDHSVDTEKLWFSIMADF